jgi:hypothetical protein
MVGLNFNNMMVIENGKSGVQKALEDAVIIFCFTALTAMVAVGWPPSVEALYVPMISSAIIGVGTYMKARGIELAKEA